MLRRLSFLLFSLLVFNAHSQQHPFLPALPRAWKTGQFAGLCVRGGAQVAAKWSNRQVREVTITATAHTFVIKKPKSAKNVQIKKNNKNSNTSNDTIRVNMHPGETVKLVF